MTERIKLVVDPAPMTRSDTRMIEEYHEQQIAYARRIGLAARYYHGHQYALDILRFYRQEGLLP